MTDLNKEALEAAAEPLTFVYTNWRGKTATRRVLPVSLRYGATEWHPEPQWLLLARDLDKDEDREFAVKDIHFSTLPAPQVAAAPAPAGDVEEMAKRLEEGPQAGCAENPGWEEMAAEAAAMLRALARERDEARARAETERKIAEAVELRATQQEHAISEQRQRISDLIRDGLGEIGKREAVERERDKAVKVLAALANLDERCGWRSDALDVTREALSRLVKKEDRT
jgi:hypothetical protein